VIPETRLQLQQLEDKGFVLFHETPPADIPYFVNLFKLLDSFNSAREFLNNGRDKNVWSVPSLIAGAKIVVLLSFMPNYVQCLPRRKGDFIQAGTLGEFEVFLDDRARYDEFFVVDHVGRVRGVVRSS
jgi:hypothetical protein